MDISDELQLSLLDTGLTTEQIERVNGYIEEASMAMILHLANRFFDEGFTPEQSGVIMQNFFGFMLDNPQHLEEARDGVDALFDSL